jgi:hypothetical protein
MRLVFSTDYALRLLMLVGREIDRLVTIAEVAARYRNFTNHLMKVAYRSTSRIPLKLFGADGRVALGRDTRPDSGGGGRSKLEPHFAVVDCENPAGYCRIASCCMLRSAIREAVLGFILRNWINRSSRTSYDRDVNCGSC